MKVLAISLFLAWTSVCAQSPVPGQPPAKNEAPPPPLPDLPDSEVIAILPDNTPFTMGDVRKYMAALPPENQTLAQRDPRLWIQSWSRMYMMAKLAEKDKLDERSPTKEQLEFQRLLLLAQAEMQYKLETITVEGPEIAKHYDEVKDRYKQVKVSAIYVSFGDKGLKEDQAKAKAEKLLAQIRKGADFTKLVHENSDDVTSREKDGYFATLSRTDNIPDALRNAVFQLKEGETSEPVRQPNGFYLLRAEKISYRPLADVRSDIFTELKNQKVQEWLNGSSKEQDPKFVNPKFPVAK